MAMIVHSIPGSGNTTPIELLCSMSGVAADFQLLAVWEGKQMEPSFLAINPMHTAPALVDGDVKIWECRAILRYICNKHKLEDFYPSDPAKRANIDCALDWNMGSMNPIVGTKMYYPWLGYAPHCTDEEFKAAEERWTKELEPSLALLIKNGGPGPFIGGAQPCIADFAIIGYLLPVCIVLPDGAVASSKVSKDYIAAFKALPKFEEIMGAAMKGAADGAAKAKAGK